MSVDFESVAVWMQGLQDSICGSLETLDGGAKFSEDRWGPKDSRRVGGAPTVPSTSSGGSTRVLSEGALFERAGVNFSHVGGDALPAAASARRESVAGQPFEAAGVSLVLHPRNPYVPTAHMNVRVFAAGEDRSAWWFGGGFDLTPYYGFDEDCVHWHTVARDACAPYGEEVYPRFKRWCDEYFHLKHRGEPRGIGGLFFDDLNQWGFDRTFAFTRAVGEAFIHAYTPIVERRRGMDYGERERGFQAVRRGRYVEFNLVCDRGTLFGLQSGGRTESILMSLPPRVEWRYDWRPEPGTPEAELTERYLVAKDWV